MKILSLLLVFVLAALKTGGPADAAEPIAGWRGDGTGKYPAAEPPTTWGRVAKAMRGLRFQAARPGESDAGASMADGVIREWLVLSPAPEGDKVEEETLPGEAALSPLAGDKIGEAVWKPMRVETGWLDFNRLLENPGRRIACALTHFHSDTGGKFLVNVTHLGGFRMVLNGVPLPNRYGRYPIDLAKGWNRLLVKTAPRDADWACGLVFHARWPAEFESTNIAWIAPLPGINGGYYGGGTGCGSPVIVGDRMYLLSEPHDLICLEKEDGKLLWIKTNSYFDAATVEDRQKPAYAEAAAIAAKLDLFNASLLAGGPWQQPLEEKIALEKQLSKAMEKVDADRYAKSETPDVGYSGFTPITDGTSVYLWLGSGITAAYDLDGNRRWIRADILPAVEHGFSSSPILVDGKIVVFMRDLLAIEAATGALAWRIPVVSHQGANPGGFFHGTPAAAAIGGVPLVILGNGTIVRASDGKVLVTRPQVGNQAIGSPVLENDLLLQTNTWGMQLFIERLPAAIGEPLSISTRTVSIDTPGFPRYYLPWYIASPLVHDGLAYLVNNSGVLTVVDVKDGRVIDQRMLDVDHFQTSNEGPARGVGISPTLAGKYLFILGNNGGAVVLEPGRGFKQVRKNKIENIVAIGHWGERQERFVANPVFDGRRLYIRGEGNLYAIGPSARPFREPSTAIASKAANSAPRPGAPTVHASPPEAEQASGAGALYGWRREGSGTFPDASPPVEWSEQRNIKWRAAVGAGYASPIILRDRVILVSEPGILLSLDRGDGKVVWKAEIDADLPAEIKSRARSPRRIFERARATPVTDGTDLYVALCTGIVARYSLDGKRQWVQFVEPAALTYGPSASPVLAGDKLLIESRHLNALDPGTGRILWKANEGGSHYGTPAAIRLDGAAFAVTSKGAVVRVSDGAVLADRIAPGLGGDQAPSPIAGDGAVYFMYKRSSAVGLTYRDGKIDHRVLWEQELPGDVIASPVRKDGMLFAVTHGSGEYRVLDERSGEVLLERELGISANLYPSLALAGNHLYIMNDKGDTLVLEPSREFKEIRRNGLPHGSGASAAFTGSNIYVRGGEFLYSIGP